MSEIPPPPEDFNPYSAPKADLAARHSENLPPEFLEAEAIRRRYINHEASIKSIGSLSYLGAILCGILVVALAVPLFQGNLPQGGTGVVLVLYIVISALNFAVGYGLTNLKTWGRWLAVVLNGLGVLSLIFQTVALVGLQNGSAAWGVGVATAFPLIIVLYILYLLLSSKGSYVFSPEYREIIRQTPHVKYKMGCLVKGFVGLLLAVIILAVVGAVVGTVARR